MSDTCAFTQMQYLMAQNTGLPSRFLTVHTKQEYSCTTAGDLYPLVKFTRTRECN
jgi:hypothetical protein